MNSIEQKIEKKPINPKYHCIFAQIFFDMDTIVRIVKQLSPSEKQQLGEVLWDEQIVDDIVISEEHKQVVRERIKKYENIPDCYLTWDDIERKMANRI